MLVLHVMVLVLLHSTQVDNKMNKIWPHPCNFTDMSQRQAWKRTFIGAFVMCIVWCTCQKFWIESTLHQIKLQKIWDILQSDVTVAMYKTLNHTDDSLVFLKSILHDVLSHFQIDLRHYEDHSIHYNRFAVYQLWKCTITIRLYIRKRSNMCCKYGEVQTGWVRRNSTDLDRKRFAWTLLVSKPSIASTSLNFQMPQKQFYTRKIKSFHCYGIKFCLLTFHKNFNCPFANILTLNKYEIPLKWIHIFLISDLQICLLQSGRLVAMSDVCVFRERYE